MQKIQTKPFKTGDTYVNCTMYGYFYSVYVCNISNILQL
jgi:hypothetical protein